MIGTLSSSWSSSNSFVWRTCSLAKAEGWKVAMAAGCRRMEDGDWAGTGDWKCYTWAGSVPWMGVGVGERNVLSGVDWQPEDWLAMPTRFHGEMLNMTQSVVKKRHALIRFPHTYSRTH